MFVARRVSIFAMACIAASIAGCGGGWLARTDAVTSESARGAVSAIHSRTTPSGRLLTWVDADVASPSSWQQAAPYVDYAIVGQSTSDITLAQTIAAAGIGVVEYTNPNRQAQAGIPHFPDNEPGDYAVDCTGARIYKVGVGVPTPPPPVPTPTPLDLSVYLMDPHSANLASSWAGEVTGFAQSVGSSPTFVFEDQADSLAGLSRQPPCDYAQPDWTTAGDAMDEAMLASASGDGVQTQILYNGLDTGWNAPSPTYTPSAMGLNASTSGGMAENCYSKVPGATRVRPAPTPYPAHDDQWLSTENVEIAMAASGDLFVCNANSDATVDAGNRTELRKYVIASLLLTYDPAATVVDEQFRTKSGLSVFPESQMFAQSPIDPTPSQISDLLIGGVYARRYAACSIAGSPIGACVVVVNPSSSGAHPFPYPGQYDGTVHITGGGVLEPGSQVFLSASPPPAVQPESAIIAYVTSSMRTRSIVTGAPAVRRQGVRPSPHFRIGPSTLPSPR